MNKLNRHFQGRLDLAIQIFLNQYSRKFMHQLVSSQLDIDRMDYLTRDSFFTGVNEGIIGYDRLLKMMSVKEDQLVWEEKGIHSIEKFILSRSIMYWQVYMHKTVLSAEFLIIDVLKRAQALVDSGHDLPASPMLKWFMEHQPDDATLENDPEVLNKFLMLDDSDVLVSCKMWITHPDPTLRFLANKLLDRDLHQVMLSNQPFSALNLEHWNKSVIEMNADVQSDYLFATGVVENDVYNPAKGAIKILQKDGRIVDFAEVSTHMRHLLEEKNVVKHFVYLPKGCASS
jgi:HD superfamily phosphohydrolase